MTARKQKSPAKAPTRKAAPKKAGARAASKKAGARAASKKASARVAPKKAGGAKAGSTPKVSPTRGTTVDAYVAKVGGWQAEVIQKVRELIREHAPSASEVVKWGQPVYEHNGPFAYIKAFASQVNFGFWRGVDLLDPEKILEGDGDRMRHHKLRSLADLRPAALAELVRQAVSLNQKKGDPTKRG